MTKYLLAGLIGYVGALAMCFACAVLLGMLDLFLLKYGIDWLSSDLNLWLLSISPMGLLLWLCGIITFAILSVLSFKFLL